MNRELYPIFSTPIYMSRDQQLALDYYDKITSLDYYRMTANGWITEDTYVLEREDLAPLKDYITSHINNFLHNDLQVQDDLEFYITNSWVTIHDKDDYAPLHDHVNSLFSGTFYIDIPEDDDSVFELVTKDHYRIFPHLIQPQIKDYNLFNSNGWSIKPETGTLILFPSSLKHATTVMSSNNRRYCIAFNIFLKGDVHSLFGNDKNSINRLVLK